MGYRRLNITLPEDVARRLGKVSNKSAFIARAVVERLDALERREFRRRLIRDYREGGKDPEELTLARELDGTIGDGLEGDDW